MAPKAWNPDLVQALRAKANLGKCHNNHRVIGEEHEFKFCFMPAVRRHEFIAIMTALHCRYRSLCCMGLTAWSLG